MYNLLNLIYEYEHMSASYNAVSTDIINPAVEPVNEKNRTFGTFDMFPTTLAAMGVEIPGDRLGLGTNLFSATPTLAEVHGVDYLNGEFQKNSDFYNSKFLDMYPTETTKKEEE